jgi:sialic acid synthase SpsE
MAFRLGSPPLPQFREEISIHNRSIGTGSPCYVIAEVGSNHDRDLKKALALVDAAADAGCDAVKFQTFEGRDIAAAYVDPATEPSPTFRKWGARLLDIYEKCALPDSFHEPLAERAAERRIHFFSSAFSEKAVERLHRLGVPAIKIASFEMVHLPLIRCAASTGLPLIISTGMAGLGEIERALAAVADGGGNQVVLLHCGSSYPLSVSSANLAAMATLRAAFGVPVGYSDHTLGITVSVAAATLGAAALEKHITLNRSGDGPDHGFSIEPSELGDMVSMMRDAQVAVGSTRKFRQPEEMAPSVRGRRSLFARRRIESGQTLTEDDVKVVRPGIGLEPLVLPLILGRPLTRSVDADQPLTWEHFLGARHGISQ